jgi:regulator of protease activity HflC (stomatin/prohibitin superfamily)
MREREMTIKGQEILTSDKVAIRVSIVVRYRVLDPTAAIHAVEDYEARIYTDVQLAARRSLASMSLEEILTNRNRLSDDILSEVKESAASYGVEIGRADVKDLVFPGNLEQIMNRVLTAERMAEAQLVEARANSEVQRIEAETQADVQRIRAEAQAQETRLAAEAEADAEFVKAQAEIRMRGREQSAAASCGSSRPAPPDRARTLRDLAQTATARLYISFDSNPKPNTDE